MPTAPKYYSTVSPAAAAIERASSDVTPPEPGMTTMNISMSALIIC